MSDETPTIPESVLACPADSFAVFAWTKLVLSHYAQYMAARYNGPVFLTGSSLRSGVPRDVDVRVIVSDAEFCGRYGVKHYSKGWPNQHWIDDMAKRNGELAALHRLNPDFQVYPASHAIQYDQQPRILLAAPTNLDHIIESTRWWYGPHDETAEAKEGAA
jgi:hypothetical protein